MDEDEAPRAAAGSAADFARQLREAADRLTAGWPGLPGGPGSAAADAGVAPFPPPPATLTARHLQAVLQDIEIRRTQVQALRAQLGAFDEQLTALETSLRPLLEWTRTWADLEGGLAAAWRLPGSGL